MRRILNMPLIVFFGAWFAASGAGAPPGEPAGALTIGGQVFDHMGAGVQDMTVTLHRVGEAGPEPEPVSRARTTEFGDFSLAVPPDSGSRFVVRFFKTGFAEVERSVELVPDEPPPFIDVQAEGALRAEGRVWNKKDASPLVGAMITVSDGYSTLTARSDERGRFEVSGVSPRNVQVRVEAPGFATMTQSLSIQPGMEPVEFWLEAGWTAVARVLDPMGHPIPEVSVEAVMPNSRSLLTGVTDQRGEVAFTGLSEDADRVMMRFLHFVLPITDGFEHEIERTGEAAEVRKEFRVELAARVRGLITDAATKEPIYSARVIGGLAGASVTPKAWSDWDGRYSLTSLPAGLVALTVHHAEYAPEIHRIELAPGQTRTVDFDLGPGRALSGRVADSKGQPIEQAFVNVIRWRGYETAGLRALTDERGRFMFEHAPLDPLELLVVRHGFEPALVTAKPDAEEELRIEMSPDASGAAGGPDAVGLSAGEQAPDFEIQTADGAKMKLGDLSGKVVLVEFWATWCGPCRQQIPDLKKTYERFGSRGDFVMIGISLDHDRNAWQSFIRKEGLAWHQALDRPEASDSVASRYGVTGIPAACLIDGQGRVAATAMGEPIQPEAIGRLLE